MTEPLLAKHAEQLLPHPMLVRMLTDDGELQDVEGFETPDVETMRRLHATMHMVRAVDRP